MSDNSKMKDESNSQTRRKALKTIGGASLAAVSVPGMASAQSAIPFMCSVSFPSMFEKDDTMLRPASAGVIAGQYGGGYDDPYNNGILIPDRAQGLDCAWYGGACDTYEARVPFNISWTTEASYSDIGEVILDLNIESPRDSGYEGSGWGWIFDTSEETVESRNAPGSLTCEYAMKDGISENYFRPTEITMELDFTDSNIYDGTLTETYSVTVPNDGLMNTENLVQTSDSIYDEGVNLADELVKIDLGKLRLATRLWAYSSTVGSDLIDPDGLPEQAVVKGISAFEGPIEERQEKDLSGVDYVETLSGPTIMRTG